MRPSYGKTVKESASTTVATGLLLAAIVTVGNSGATASSATIMNSPPGVYHLVSEDHPLGVRHATDVDHDQVNPLPTHVVTSGDTLSGVSRDSCGDEQDWTGLYQVNRGVIGANPDLIRPGQDLSLLCVNTGWHAASAIHETAVVVPTVPKTVQRPVTHVPVTHAPVAHASTSGYGGFQACVIRRESGGNPQVMNGSGHYGLYQFSYSTWVANGGSPRDFGHASVAEQDRVFATAMSKPGGANNWAPYDGC